MWVVILGLSLLIHWALGYFAVRISVYEEIYYYERRLTLGFWLGRVTLMLFFGGIFLFVAALDGESENVRRAFFLPPEKQPNDHIRAKTALGNFFNIKEDK